jgi:hypothetical protein
LRDEIDKVHVQEDYVEGADSMHDSCGESECSSHKMGDGKISDDSDESHDYPDFSKRMTMRESKTPETKENGPNSAAVDNAEEKKLDQDTANRRENNIKRQLGENVE